MICVTTIRTRRPGSHLLASQAAVVHPSALLLPRFGCCAAAPGRVDAPKQQQEGQRPCQVCARHPDTEPRVIIGGSHRLLRAAAAAAAAAAAVPAKAAKAGL
eukprot:GHRQ01031236.1.p4 GENE.GHRQ01031236.1~~GHRQ01031236.1.p4  ORF type:complete len:102 (-),score=35.88 GHRQ01031236.1:560-865(-)